MASGTPDQTVLIRITSILSKSSINNPSTITANGFEDTMGITFPFEMIPIEVNPINPVFGMVMVNITDA